MTPDELTRYDGREGRPAYVAVARTIYDVSASEYWREGNHEGEHQAGRDLTEELKSAPHVRAVVERFPVVGTLSDVSAGKPGKSSRLSLLSVLIILFVVILLLVTFLI